MKKNSHFSYVETSFTPEYEQLVRTLTLEPHALKAAVMKPQDTLVYAFITVNRTTGISSEFGWKSGRKDVHVVVDLPAEVCSQEQLQQRANEIEILKGKHYGNGFSHEEYEGGFAEFAQNFERNTGRECAAAVRWLCESQRQYDAGRIASKVG